MRTRGIFTFTIGTVVGLVLGLSAGGAGATSYILVPDTRLADTADLIVTAEVGGHSYSRATGKVTTDYTVVVNDVIKGEVAGSALLVRALGGWAPEEGYTLKIWGTPRLTSGETVLLFLVAESDGSFHILHLLQGAFHRLESGGESFFVRSLDGARRVDVPSVGARPLAAGQARAAEPFARWLRDRSAGRRRAPDYVREMPPAAVSLSEKFTNLSGDNDEVLRWFDFANGETVRWKRDRNGLPAPRANQQFRNALLNWNRLKPVPGAGMLDAGSPTIRLGADGTTGSTLGFDALDELNTILGRDYNDDMDPFDCASGGTIALGGVHGVLRAMQSWKGRQTFATVEAEIINNDDVVCLFRDFRKGAAETWIHELGHTLGLGHSCGDDVSPACNSDARLGRATMAARFHGDGRGARLAMDDLYGAWFLYDEDETSPVPCGEVRPGANRFCRSKKCGPCGEGQGNCANNNQCLGDLTCVRNVGADFGFSPNTNVCLP